MRVNDFFRYAVERENVRRRKEYGLVSNDIAHGHYTNDPVLQQWRFCNIHREDDRVTRWFAQNVRDRLDDDPAQQLFSCVAFRWFNRISTGEKILAYLLGDREWSTQEVGVELADCSPVVTGAYIIKTPNGMTKLDGVLQCIEWFMSQHPKFEKDVEVSYRYEGIARAMSENRGGWTLEQVWNWLKGFSFLGDFMAYEIVTDLANTPLLRDAPDKMTWANPGPGAARGLSRLLDEDKDHFNRASKKDRPVMMELMQYLLDASKDRGNWPSDWEPWDMRTVEHTLCEFDKYERAQQGGRLKNRYST